MDDVYQHILARYEAIREAGYELIVQWECKWQDFKEECEYVQVFEQGLRIVLRLEPRDVFIGGRTEAIQLYADTEEDEEIRYLDFTSLYPFVNNNCGYRIGHPRIITKPSSSDISSYFGLVSCTILPPAELYHPVLPYRTGGKLTFPLCSSCVESQLPKSIHNRTRCCHHTDTDQALKGTWCTPELEEALM